MKCRICGCNMKSITTALPFKVSEQSIVMIKDIPTFQCENCFEYLLDDSVMARVDVILSKITEGAELEIVQFAA